MIAQNEINVPRELAYKTDNRTVSYSIKLGGLSFKLNNDACTIIPYPTGEVKHI